MQTKEIWLGLDLGTTGIRCVAFNQNFEVIDSEYIEYELIFNGNFVEQDASMWFELSKKVIKRITNRIDDSKLIHSISISSQGITFVPIDENGKIIRSAITWLDMRGDEYLHSVVERFSSDKILDKTGKILNGAYVLPKILWLKENEPGNYQKTKFIMMPMDYIIWKFTGNFLTDHTMAAGTMLYNIHTGTWDQQILEEFRIEKNLFPEIVHSGTWAGEIHHELLELLNLPQNTKLFVGGQDQKCAALAAGLRSDRLTLSLGTSGAIEVLMDKPYVDEKGNFSTFSYIYENSWVSEAVINNAGVALKWIRQVVASELSYAKLDQLVGEKYPSVDNLFFLPALNENLKENIIDNPNGVFWGMTLGTQQIDLVLSVMEAVAFEVERKLEDIRKAFIDLKVESISMFGGGANSEIWCQMISDITGLKINLLSNNEMAATGAAMIAAKGKTKVDDYSKFQSNIQIVQEIFPSHHSEHMQARYQRYLKLFNYIYREH